VQIALLFQSKEEVEELNETGELRRLLGGFKVSYNSKGCNNKLKC